MPSAFDTAADVWVPIGNDQAECRMRCRPIYAVARLKPGVTIAGATAEMNGIREQLRLEHPADYEAGAISVVSMRDALTGHVRTALYVLLGAVGFVLLIACANVANLLLARAVARGASFALRAALGAGRGRIARQLLTESLMLGAGRGGGCSWRSSRVAASRRSPGHAAAAGSRRRRRPGPGLHRGHCRPDERAVRPRARVARRRRRCAADLAIDSRGSVGGRSRARAVLVVVDLALALVLLAGAGVMIRTVATLAHASRGFDSARILAVQFSLTGKAFTDDGTVIAFQQRAVERIRAIPGVDSVALAGQIPFARAGGGAGDCWWFHAAGRMKPNPADDPCVERFGVTPDYFRVLGIPVLSGRAFNGADTSSAQRVILISQSTAKPCGPADPIGSQVRIGNARAARGGRSSAWSGTCI
jgi:putative ABC transport system permease protein